MDNRPLIFESLLDAPVSKVWSAITDKNEMKIWYFDLAEFKAEKGFRFEFLAGEEPHKQFLHLCEVTEVIDQKKLTYSWRYKGYAGNSFVTFELFGEGSKTLLRLTHTGLDTFPNEPDFAVTNFEAGWKQIIGTSLRNYLENNK